MLPRDKEQWSGRVEIPEGRDDIITTTYYHSGTDDYPVRNKRIEPSQAVLDWGAENNIKIYDLMPLFPRTLYFKTVQDAILFKLRWL